MNKVPAISSYQFSLDGKGQVRADQLWIKDLVDEFGSPLNIISQTQLIQNLRALKESFAFHWQGPVRVLPAIKCNTSLALCRAMAAETDGCDLFSEGELISALESGFRPEYLSLNGNSKLTGDMAFLKQAIQQGVRITLDDKVEFGAIETIAKSLGIKARIRLRVRPRFPGMNEPSDFSPDAPVPAEIAAFAYKAGIPTEDLEELGKKALNSNYVELTGLHLHLGRHCAGMKFWQVAMQGYARLIADLKKCWNGWEPVELDIGGGFSQQFDPMMSVKKKQAENRELTWLSRLSRIGGLFGNAFRYKLLASIINYSHSHIRKGDPFDLTKPPSLSLEEYGQTAGYLKAALEDLGISTKKILLELEPGRAIFGSAAIHVCQVSFIKQQTIPFPWRWIVTDTTDYWLLGGGHGPNHPYLVDGKPLVNYAEKQRMVADIVGKSCGPDRIIGDSCLPEDIKPGDLITFIGTGAYQEMQSSNFNSMGRPATVLVNGEKKGLIRRRETTKDVLSREVVPDWLCPVDPSC
jgi:diaminopimelate decarboxylase